MNIAKENLHNKFYRLQIIRRQLAYLKQDSKVKEYLKLLKMKEELTQLLQSKDKNKSR